MTTFEQLCAIVAKEHRLPPERLTPEASLDSLGIDSLGTVELLWHVEDAFKMKLPSAPEDLVTLGDVARYIDGLLAAGSGPLAPAIPTVPVSNAR